MQYRGLDKPLRLFSLIVTTGGLLFVLSGCSYIPGLDTKPSATELLQELSHDVGPKISTFRRLPALRQVTSTLISNDQLRLQLEAELEENYPEEEAIADQEEFALLDLLPQEFELRAFIEDLYAEQVLGYYDPEDEHLYVRLDTDNLSPQDRLVYVHEYVHALQDQHFDLEALEDAVEGNADQAGALHALVEGDATLASLMYAEQEFPSDEYQQLLVDEPSPIFDSAPRFIQEDFTFPYVQGLHFTLALLGIGGWDAVDAAYANPPLSSEHILHPERYLQGDDPQQVNISWVAEALGDSWTVQDTDTLGEYGLSLMLDTFTSSIAARRASQGWGGDRYVYLKGPKGRQALVLSTIWDTQRDSQEFYDAYINFTVTKAQRAWPLLDVAQGLRWWQTPQGRSIYLLRNNLEVLIILAPDIPTVRALKGALAGRSSTTSLTAGAGAVVELAGSGFDIAVDPVRGWLFVSIPSENEVVVISMSPLRILDRIDFEGGAPHGLHLGMNGDTLYVALNQAGIVAAVDLNTKTVTEIPVSEALGDSRVYDVVEGKRNRLYVSANPGSSGIAYLAMVKLDEANSVSRLSSGGVIRARPVLLESPDMKYLYVGMGFSPQRLYKFDITTDDPQKVLEDSVKRTERFDVSPDGNRIYLKSGHVLHTGSFTEEGAVAAGVPKVSLDGRLLYVFIGDTYDGNRIVVYDSASLAVVDDIAVQCAPRGLARPASRVELSPGGLGLYILNQELVCHVNL